MRQRSLTSLAAIVVALSCRPVGDLDAVRAQIEEAIELGVIATRDKDIDAYMALLPVESMTLDESGRRISRELQRSNTLRDWSIIDRTLAIEVMIDSLRLARDSAVVFTSQKWERLMFRRDGVTLDTILTTQKHEETWRPTPDGWRSFVTRELGGVVWINGEVYEPES